MVQGEGGGYEDGEKKLVNIDKIVLNLWWIGFWQFYIMYFLIKIKQLPLEIKRNDGAATEYIVAVIWSINYIFKKYY